MRKLKLLITAAALMLGVGAYAQTNYEVGTKYTDLDALVKNGTLFSIVNETDQKACGFGYSGGADQDMVYKSYDDIIANTKSYTFKLEADGEHYNIRCYTPAGELYVVWGWAQGFFNSQAADKSVCFALNKDQDGVNLAVWDVVSDENGKFLLKNVGTGLYLKDNAPAKYEEANASHYTFCVLRQSLTSVTTAFNAMKANAKAVADVEYKETTAGSHTTLLNAIDAQQEIVNNATTVDAVTQATADLKAAILTYIAGAEPKNDGQYFNLTFLMANPDFEDGSNGWTFTNGGAPGVNWSNCEYYEKEFDINQTITGLPTGSYSLSVQAFQRPGWAGNVYTDYVNGTNNASSVLYINSITSNVKNIAADAQSAYKLGDGSNFEWPNDSRVGSEGNYKYVPNSQQGAKLWFEAGLYDATCAAVVTAEDGGSLKLGFKSTKTHVGGDLTIFDNFRFYYYGSSLLIYYKQYLPQLKREASADLANGAYANVTGKEKADFVAALAATPDAETEAAYKTVIDNITAKQTAFREAAPAYDALVAAKAEAKLEKITANIGNGVFQYDATTNDNLYTAYETAYNTMMATSAVYSENPFATAENINTYLGLYNDRKNAYQNLELNAPVEGMKYNIVVATEGHAKAGNAVIIVSGETSDNNPTGYGLNANLAPNANLAQAVTFTKVSGNKYNISFETAEGTAYLTYGKTNGSAAGWADSQIQATTDADKKGVFTIVATTTDNVFNIVNNITNTKIDCQNGGNIYTDENITLDGFSVAEASEASVSITIDANVKLATRIFPFTVTLPEGVKAFSCDGVNEGVLELTEVVTLEANVPYILYAKEGYDGALTGWGTATDTKYTEGLLTGVYVDTPAPGDSWVLQKQDGDVSFYKVGDAKPTVGANRAYLTPEGQSPARLSFPFEDELTAIDAIKAMTSGKVEIYNVSGAKLPALQKGMNILKTNDGRSLKVMVK